MPRIRVSRRPRAPGWTGLLGLALVGCSGGSAPAPSVAPVNPDCILHEPGDRSRRDTIRVAMPEADLHRFIQVHSSDTASRDCGSGPSSTWQSISAVVGTMVPLDSGPPVLRLIPITPAIDPRDLVDQQVDVILTADPTTQEYARARPGRSVVPLAWGTTYVLVVPERVTAPVTVTQQFRVELAHEVVRADARPAADSGWWNANPCPVQPPHPAGRLPEVMIPAHDPIARAIAERLVALAPAGGPRRISASTRPQLDSALGRAAAAAFVIPLPRLPSSDCRLLPNLPERAQLFPLVEVRASAVLGPGVPPFLILPDGAIRFRPSP